MTLGLAVLTYRLVERPLLNSRSRSAFDRAPRHLGRVALPVQRVARWALA